MLKKTLSYAEDTMLVHEPAILREGDPFGSEGPTKVVNRLR